VLHTKPVHHQRDAHYRLARDCGLKRSCEKRRCSTSKPSSNGEVAHANNASRHASQGSPPLPTIDKVTWCCIVETLGIDINELVPHTKAVHQYLSAVIRLSDRSIVAASSCASASPGTCPQPLMRSMVMRMVVVVLIMVVMVVVMVLMVVLMVKMVVTVVMMVVMVMMMVVMVGLRAVTMMIKWSPE
jgi:hypothetical protein